MSETENNELAGKPVSEDGKQGRGSWSPNRTRKVRSKKAFDREKFEQFLDDDKPLYKGELDPRKRDTERKPRSVSRHEERVRRKADKLAENDPVASATKAAKITDFRGEFERNNASPARLAALYATQAVRRRRAFAQEVIEATIDKSTLSVSDRAFATLLTLGVVSTWGALDQVIDRCLNNPRDIKPDVRDAMRISTYEIVFLKKQPHAAIDQGVELVRAVAPSAAGLANAVLHRVLKASESFPFGDPCGDLDALALSLAFPSWLATTLIEDMGIEAAVALMRASNDPAPLFIHVNALKSKDEEIFDLFGEVGVTLEAASAGDISPAGCFRVADSRSLSDGRIQRLFQQGKILVSDAAAQAVTACVVEAAGQGSVLEIGAGRGTKTVMMQSMAQRAIGRQLELTSMDNHAFKTDLLRKRAEEYGIEIAEIVTGNAARLDSSLPGRAFDLVFVDAPCSGLGTLRRHQDIRWRIEPEQIEDLAHTGLDMLKSAASHVAPGGSIVYATCTVTYTENNGVVKGFLESAEGAAFKLAPINGKACFSSQLSGNSPDAHFAARFVRVQ